MGIVPVRYHGTRESFSLGAYARSAVPFLNKRAELMSGKKSVTKLYSAASGGGENAREHEDKPEYVGDDPNSHIQWITEVVRLPKRIISGSRDILSLKITTSAARTRSRVPPPIAIRRRARANAARR